ncbi:MAG: hypothetical protein JWQ35_1388 [Bacteriovoracaceae bacterium]|nr:hypothetical protein [Bacteriovoracaceae bacterium]
MQVPGGGAALASAERMTFAAIHKPLSINFLFFLILFGSALNGALAFGKDSDDKIISLFERGSNPNLNELLTEIRSSRESPVEVTIRDELDYIRKEYLNLDPLTLGEALTLSRQLGIVFGVVYSSLDLEKSPEVRKQLRIEARQRLNQVLAVSLKYKASAEKMEGWFLRRPKTWSFLSEVISITGAVLGADLALKGQANFFEVVLKAYGIGFSVLGSAWIPTKALIELSRRKKFARIFDAFLLGANIKRIDPLEYHEAVSAMKMLSRDLHYPVTFPKCALALQKISNSFEADHSVR